MPQSAISFSANTKSVQSHQPQHSKSQSQSTFEVKFITQKKTARGWLLLAPQCDTQLNHFNKIKDSKDPILYLTDTHSNSPPEKRHYIQRVDNLPEYILNDSIIKSYHDQVGNTVNDIIEKFKKKSGKIFLGSFDIPSVYQFSDELDREHDCFNFKPAFNYLNSNCSSLYIVEFLNFDNFWETSTWNAFTYSSDFRLALLLPNYEVESKVKFSNTLNELMFAPPDQNNSFPGGSSYIKLSQHFDSRLHK